MSLHTLLEKSLGGREPLAIARANAAHWAAWLAPISAAHPCGEDPGYDDAFEQVREEVGRLSGADAARVQQLCEQLLRERCKDLRVASYYLWARLHQHGEAGLADALGLLAALLARYGQALLPSRPARRTQALEWLASPRVLGSLARYPEVAPAEAAATAAALAWLDAGLAAWPVDQRPALGGVYSALLQRLEAAGGQAAVVPQQLAAPAAAPAPPISSGRDLLDHGRQLAAWLQAQPHGWLAAQRLLHTLRWDTLQQVPPQDAQGHTRLAPPRAEQRTQLQRLARQRAWPALQQQAGQAFCEGVNHFWLDLQHWLHMALVAQPEPCPSWAAVLRQDVASLLQRLPGLEALCWQGGTPMASDSTREWLAREVTPAATGLLAASPLAAAAGDGALALEAEALALADASGVEAALAWLAAQPLPPSGRERGLLQLVMARVAEQCGKAELAIHLLGALEATCQAHGLANWEPALAFEVRARLLKLLRSKAQRGDADKPALAQRMNALLAQLVAADPAGAAILCN